jgi:hypothetical protein
MPEETIWIVTSDTVSSIDHQRRNRDILKEESIKVSVSELEQKMSHFLQSVGRIFQQAEYQAASHSPMQLDEIELSVEISGEGEIKLMGTGGKAGGKGAITLKFKKLSNQSIA